MKQEYAVRTRNLTKTYQKKTAVSHVDLEIRKGEIFGFIGRNGAGKSTTLKMCCGLVHPTEGEITLFGSPVTDEAVRRRIGVLIEEAGLYRNLSARENMILKADCMGITDGKKVDELLETMGLAQTGKKKVKSFSMGMKQRLGIALALLGNPDLLVLDEPINGLDPEGIREIRHFLQKLNEETGKTIVISSHILGELSKLATCYGIIKDGLLIQQMTREELEEKCRDYLSVQVDDAKRAAVLLEEAFPNVSYQVQEEERIHIYSEVDSAVLTTRLVQHGVQVISCALHQMDLEHYFLELMEGGGRHA